jgi:hypothetical protein
VPRSFVAEGPAGCAAVAAALLGAASAAGAAEWSNAPGVTLGAGHDTNIELSPVDGSAASNAVLTAGTEVLARDEGMQLSFRPEVRAYRYDEDRWADRTDEFMRVDLTRYNARQSWSVGGSYGNESTLTSEFEGTGLVQTDVDRTTSGLNTSWMRRAGERGSYQLSMYASDTDYGDQARFSPLVDYRYGVVQAAYTLAAGRSSWRVGVSRSALENAARASDSDSTSVTMSWSHEFSELLSGRFGVGYFEVADERGFDSEASGASYEFSVVREWEWWVFDVSGARDLEPEGTGTLVREDSVSVRTLRRLTAHASVGVALRASRLVEPGPFADLLERNYSFANVELDWQFAERWKFYGALGDRAQRLPFQDRASGRTLTLSATYRGK